MSLDSIQKNLDDIITDGLLNDFTIKHYIELKQLEKKLNEIEITENKQYNYILNILKKINTIKKLMYNSGLLHKYNEDNIYYIMRNASLLPLILANNQYEGRIKMYCNNSYMFLCQFHNENTPSLGVTDFKNLFHCFGCGASGTPISYLSLYENLSFDESVQLISQIYLYNLKANNPKLQPLVEKYQKIIISDAYMELLEMGKKRMKNRKNMDNYKIDEIYNERFEVISRIKSNQYDPGFEYAEPIKRMRLIQKNGIFYLD